MSDNKIEACIGLAGKFFLTLTNEKTGEVREYSSNNLILDSGLNRYGSGTGLWNFCDSCMVGSATDEPVATQTTMSGLMAVSTTVQSYGSVATNTTTMPYWNKQQKTFRFNTGVGTGNISQLAVGWGGSPSNGTYQGLFSLVRIKDTNGNPITITKLADEVLDVRYELQIILPSSDSLGTVVFDGQTYNFIMRPAQAGNWDSYQSVRYTTATGLFYTGDIGSQLNSPTGTSASGAANTLAASVAGTFYSDGVISAGLTNANLSGGIRSILLQFEGHRWQIQFNNVVDGSKIPKDATKIFSLNYRISFGRV